MSNLEGKTNKMYKLGIGIGHRDWACESGSRIGLGCVMLSVRGRGADCMLGRVTDWGSVWLAYLVSPAGLLPRCLHLKTALSFPFFFP